MAAIVTSFASLLVFGYMRSFGKQYGDEFKQVPHDLIIIILKFIQAVQQIVVFEEKLFLFYSALHRTSCTTLSERIKIYHPAVGPDQFIEVSCNSMATQLRLKIFLAKDSYNVYQGDQIVAESESIIRKDPKYPIWRHEEAFTAALKDSRINHLEITVGRGTNCDCPESEGHIAVKIFNDNYTFDGNDVTSRGKSEDTKAAHILVKTGIKILDNDSHYVTVSAECYEIKRIKFSSNIGICCEQARFDIGR